MPFFGKQPFRKVFLGFVDRKLGLSAKEFIQTCGSSWKKGVLKISGISNEKIAQSRILIEAGCAQRGIRK